MPVMDIVKERLIQKRVNGVIEPEVMSWAEKVRDADRIVIAAPFWDMSFPAALKVFFVDNFAMMIKDMPEEETEERLREFFEEISVLDADPNYKIFYRCGVVSMRYAMNTGDIVADCAKLAQSMGQEINTTEIHFYTKEMHENAMWGKQLKAYLDTAIRAGEFMV